MSYVGLVDLGISPALVDLVNRLRLTEVVAPLVPTVADWPRHGQNNRESLLYRLLDFRQSLQKLGFLRKSKGRLLLTKAGRDGHGDVATLRRHLVDRLGRISDDPFTGQATILVLLKTATSADAEIPLDDVAAALRQFGGKDARRPVQAHHLYGVDALGTLRNVSAEPTDRGTRDRISSEAAALARAALTSGIDPGSSLG